MTNIAFQNHWKDIKLKLFYLIGSYALTFIICIKYHISLFFFLAKFLLFLNKRFIFTKLSQGFWAYFKLSLGASVIFLTPLIIYFFFFFIIKSLFKYQIKILIILSSFTFITLFFIVKIAYFKIFPNLLIFFMNFEHKGPLTVTLEARVDQYLTFFFYFQLTIFSISLLPFLLFLCNLYFNKTRKYLYTILLLFFMVVAPPDIILQSLILIPILFLSEFFILISRIMRFFFFFLNEESRIRTCDE